MERVARKNGKDSEAYKIVCNAYLSFYLLVFAPLCCPSISLLPCADRLMLCTKASEHSKNTPRTAPQTAPDRPKTAHDQPKIAQEPPETALSPPHRLKTTPRFP